MSAYVEMSDLRRIGDWCWQRVQRSAVCDALMRWMGVGEAFELSKGVEQVVLIPDHCAVQEFAAAAPYPPFPDRVHPGHPDAAEHDFDPGVGEDNVEPTRELAVSVPDHEPRPAAVSSRSMTRFLAA